MSIQLAQSPAPVSVALPAAGKSTFSPALDLGALLAGSGPKSLVVVCPALSASQLPPGATVNYAVQMSTEPTFSCADTLGGISPQAGSANGTLATNHFVALDQVSRGVAGEIHRRAARCLRLSITASDAPSDCISASAQLGIAVA